MLTSQRMHPVALCQAPPLNIDRRTKSYLAAYGSANPALYETLLSKMIYALREISMNFSGDDNRIINFFVLKAVLRKRGLSGLSASLLCCF